MDTIEGGKWLPHQELAWTLVSTAIERVRELENEIGCFFDRNPDGTVHQKAFAGQTFDRTVHKGDLTGIEIINRLAEQVWVSGVERLEELAPLTDDLPPKERAAVVLRYGYDLDYDTIGAALGSNEQAARQAASAGVRRLRKEKEQR